MKKVEKNEKNIKNGNKSKKKHRILRFFLKFILAIIIMIVLFVGGFIGYSTFKNGWGWKGLIKTAVGTEGKSAEELGEFQCLILGISEDISAKLTDTIMVASYNPAKQSAVLISIPRDTFVGENKAKTSSYDKINAIYQSKGAEGTLKEVNKLTGLKIKNYIVISNNALVELVDAIGGVEFDVPTDMNYDSYRQDLHIDLKKGYQKLSGEQAEWLVRFRKNNDGTTYSGEWGNDDYGRMRTQREFLKAVAEQTLKAKNITKVGNIIDIVKRNVTTNISNWEEVKEYIPYALDFNLENLGAETIPGDATRVPAGTGLWFFLADSAETKKMVKNLFSDGTTKVDDSTLKKKAKIKIEIKNGTGNNSLLEDAKSSLKAQGYTVETAEKVSTTAVTSIINRSKVSEDITSEIKETLGTGVISSSSKKSSADLTIILGKDYDK